MPLYPWWIPPPFPAWEAHGYPSSLVAGELSLVPTAVTSSKGSDSTFYAILYFLVLPIGKNTSVHAETPPYSMCLRHDLQPRDCRITESQNILSLEGTHKDH